MKLLLMSDIHGDSYTAHRILMTNPKAEAVLFLGDGIREIEELQPQFPEKMFYSVRGNCDWGCRTTGFQTITLADVKILMLHGHLFDSGHGSADLRRLAEENGAQIVCYGHTHIADIDYEDGIYYLNPGSVGHPRDGAEPSYMLVDLLESGILPSVVRVKDC